MNDHIKDFVCTLLQRHGYAIVDQEELTILDSTQEYEWIANARDKMTDTQVVIVGSDERFICLKLESFSAILACHPRPS